MPSPFSPKPGNACAGRRKNRGDGHSLESRRREAIRVTPGISFLLGLATAAAIATIAADLWGRLALARVFRPLAMASIILLAAIRPAAMSESYRLLIVAGLAASLVGDVLMMLRKKNFSAGLAAFLLAHVLYTSAFLRTMPPRVEVMTVLPLLIYALFMMRTLFPHLGRLKAPVALYILVITVMTGLAVQRYINVGGTPAFFACTGALLFVISDTILAFDRFVKKLPLAQFTILGTYFTAQILFALSV
jgi:uncharacterized membrane protein YhhN